MTFFCQNTLSPLEKASKRQSKKNSISHATLFLRNKTKKKEKREGVTTNIALRIKEEKSKVVALNSHESVMFYELPKTRSDNPKLDLRPLLH